MRDFLVAPLIAAHDRDAEHLDGWRLDEEQHRLQIRGGRTPGVLVDDEPSTRLLRRTGSGWGHERAGGRESERGAKESRRDSASHR